MSAVAQAGTSLRVGTELLTVGDSAARVIELLGKPVYKSRGHGSRSGGKSSRRGGRSSNGSSTKGEKWQYRSDQGTTVVTLVDGKVTDIEDAWR